MTEKNSSIQGPFSISGNITVGGNSTTRGNAKFEHNLEVKGWLKAKNIVGTCKGLFASETKLNSCYPKPENGWWALVGNTLPAEIYRAEGKKWIDTGEQGGEIVPYLDELEETVSENKNNITSLQENKQDNLIFDDTPKENSTNPVKSGGIKKYVDVEVSHLKENKQDKLTFDNIPTEGSNNPVTSGGIKKAIDSQKSEVDAAKDSALSAISDLENNVIENFNNQKVTPEMLSESTKQLIEAAGGGTINNLPDDEDLTSKNIDGAQVLKFNDKQYNKTNFSGLGRKYLRKNIQNGKNIITQDMLSDPNTIYIIQYDYDLNGAEINIPNNCVLSFNGGSISNGIINNEFCIDSLKTKIFENVKLSDISDIYVEYIGININNDDNAPILNDFITKLDENKSFTFLFTSRGTYIFKSTIWLTTGTNFIGQNCPCVKDKPIAMTTLKFVGDFYGFTKQKNSWGNHTFKDLCLEGDSNSGGIDLVTNFSNRGDSFNPSTNLHFENVIFYNFISKCGLKITGSWRNTFLNCTWYYCGVGIYIDNSGQLNDTTFINATIESCIIGVYSFGGAHFGVNFYGGTIEGNRKLRSLSLPTDIPMKDEIVKDYLHVNSVDDVQGGVLYCGTVSGVFSGVYFEANYLYLKAHANSHIDVISCYFGITELSINAPWLIHIYQCTGNFKMTNCRMNMPKSFSENGNFHIFYINDWCNNIIFGNKIMIDNSTNVEFDKLYYNPSYNNSSFINKSSVLQNGNSFSFERIPLIKDSIETTKEIKVRGYNYNTDNNDIYIINKDFGESGKYNMYGDKYIPTPTKDGGIYINTINSENAINKDSIFPSTLYLCDNIAFNPLNKTLSTPYLFYFNGREYLDVFNGKLNSDSTDKSKVRIV